MEKYHKYKYILSEIYFCPTLAKAAYGKFMSPEPDEVTGEDRTGLFLVPFEQPPFPSKEFLAKEGINNVGDLIFVKYCYDEREILRVDEKGKLKQNLQHSVTKVKDSTIPKNDVCSRTKQKPTSNASKNGLLGNLLGRQEQTNRNLLAVPSKRRSNQNAMSNDKYKNDTHDSIPQQEKNLQAPIFITSNQLISKFRSKIEKELLSFASSSQTEIKVEINLAKETRSLNDIDEKAKVTMDVLKFIVFEQTEEIGEDEWVATKEPSEFMDEAKIAIYKAGHAPAEVIEELNKGEIPDEERQQQRAIRDAFNREEKKKAKLEEEKNVKKASEQNREVKRLNNVKRDRRSIEEIQRDMMSNVKRSRS